MPSSSIQIGDTVISKQRAQRIVERAKKNGKAQNRLGEYEIVQSGKQFQVMHTLGAGEQEIMRLQCATEGHAYTLSGICLKCHYKKED